MATTTASDTPIGDLILRITSGAMDMEGAQRLLAYQLVQASAGGGTPAETEDTAQPFTRGATEAACRLPPGALTPQPPAPAATRASGGQSVTFPFVLRDRHDTIADIELRDVESTVEAYAELVSAAYIMGGSAGPAALRAGLLGRMHQLKSLAELAGEQRDRFEQNLHPSGGTTEEMLAPAGRLAELTIGVVDLEARHSQFERALGCCEEALRKHEQTVAQLHDRFADAAVIALRERLTRSRAELVAQAQRYGLSPADVHTYSLTGVLDARLKPVRPAQRQAVASIKALLVRLGEARTELTGRENDSRITDILLPLTGAIIALADPGSFTPAPPGPGTTNSLLASLLSAQSDIRGEAAAALTAYVAARSISTTAHPALRFIKDPVPVHDGAIDDTELAIRIATSLHRVYEATQTIEERVLAPGGLRSRVYDYPALVWETLQLRAVDPVSVEATMVRETVTRTKARKEAVDSAFTWGVAITQMAATVAGAGLAALVIQVLSDAVTILQEVDGYDQERSAFASSLSAVESLGAQDPSRIGITTAVLFAALELL